MNNLNNILGELNEEFQRNLAFSDIFTELFIEEVINYHLYFSIPFENLTSSKVTLGKHAFFFGLPCKTVANFNVMRQVEGSPWKRDGSVNTNTFLVNDDILQIIIKLFYV